MLSARSPLPSANPPRSASHSRTSSFLKGVGTFLGEALKEAAERANERAALAETQREAAAKANRERLAAEEAEMERLEAERLQAERNTPQSVYFGEAEASVSTASSDSKRTTSTADPHSASENEAALTNLMNILNLLSKPSNVQQTPSVAVGPSPTSRAESTSSVTRTIAPAGWRSHNFPIMGVSVSLPANHSIMAGASGPGTKLITVPSGRRDIPFTFVLSHIYSSDGISESRERQNRTYVNNGKATVTPVSSAKPLQNVSPDITATISQHRNDNYDTLYIVVLSSNARGRGIWLSGVSDRADASALRAMTESIARTICFNPTQTLNSATHLLVGSYVQSASQSSTSYYSRASFHEETSLYLFSDGFYILVIFSKTFGFAAGMSGMSQSNTKTESGYWDTEGSTSRGDLTLRELGETQEAGMEQGVRVCQYETGGFGVVIQMRNKTLRRKGPLRLEDFHSL